VNEEILLKYAAASFLKNSVERNWRPRNQCNDEVFVIGEQDKEYVKGNII
jgi:hypothetical protein